MYVNIQKLCKCCGFNCKVLCVTMSQNTRDTIYVHAHTHTLFMHTHTHTHIQVSRMLQACHKLKPLLMSA